MGPKPKLDIPKGMFEKLFDLLAVITYTGSLLCVIAVWGKIPDQVPAHFDGLGNVDRWGSKWELLMLPVLTAVLFVFLTFLERHPEWHNYMNLTKDNIEFQYKNSKMMLNFVKNECVILLSYIQFNSAHVALGYADSLGAGFMPVFLGVLFGTIILFIIRSFRNQ